MSYSLTWVATDIIQPPRPSSLRPQLYIHPSDPITAWGTPLNSPPEPLFKEIQTMSQNPRHSGILYTPADGHPPSTSAPPVPRWTHPRRSRPSSVVSHPKPKRTVIENAKRRVVKLQRWAKKRVRKLTLQQKILGSLLVLFVSVSAILMLVFHSQILHAMLPVASKLRWAPPPLELCSCCSRFELVVKWGSKS